MTRCTRCGDYFDRAIQDQYHCPRCEAEVRALLRRDAERRRPRWDKAKDLTGALS